MGMLTNGPALQCSFSAQSKCRGDLHEYDVQMFAKPDGTPVTDAPKEKTLICEGHFPDPDDPKFLTCVCRLCKERKRGN